MSDTPDVHTRPSMQMAESPGHHGVNSRLHTSAAASPRGTCHAASARAAAQRSGSCTCPLHSTRFHARTRCCAHVPHAHAQVLMQQRRCTPAACPCPAPHTNSRPWPQLHLRMSASPNVEHVGCVQSVSRSVFQCRNEGCTHTCRCMPGCGMQNHDPHQVYLTKCMHGCMAKPICTRLGGLHALPSKRGVHNHAVAWPSYTDRPCCCHVIEARMQEQQRKN